MLEEAGAESLDAAREAWWVGLRDAEQAHYEAAGGDFQSAEETYRRGFVSALHPESRGVAYAKRRARLRERHGEAAEHDAFRRGYERGQSYRALALERSAAASKKRAVRTPRPGARRRSPGEASR